tara:strand:- start:122 stop:454 length:333 start_codon:yes stop_codon:yes gene_type:complete
MSKFAVGRYRLCESETRAEDIRIIKITPSFITFHIVEYHGYTYSLYDVIVRRKIHTDKYGNEYINVFYYRWNAIFKPTAQELDMDCKFDALSINADDLKPYCYSFFESEI